MSEDWNQRCREHLKEHEALCQLAITGLDGQVYGISNAAEFPVTADVTKAILERIKSENYSSITLNGETYIFLQKSPEHWMGKSGKKTLFMYLCNTVAIIGLSIDTEKAIMTSNGNNSVAKLHDYYKSINF